MLAAMFIARKITLCVSPDAMVCMHELGLLSLTASLTLRSQAVCKACMLLEGLNRGRPGLGVGRSRQRGGARADNTPSALSRAAREGAAGPPAALPNGAATPPVPGSSAPSDHAEADGATASAAAAVCGGAARYCASANGGYAALAAPCGSLEGCAGDATLGSGAARSSHDPSGGAGDARVTVCGRGKCRGVPAEPCAGVGARADGHAAGGCAAVAAPAHSGEQRGDPSGGAEPSSSPAAGPACSRACSDESAPQSCVAHGAGSPAGQEESSCCGCSDALQTMTCKHAGAMSDGHRAVAIE